MKKKKINKLFFLDNLEDDPLKYYKFSKKIDTINKGEIRAGGVRAGKLKADYILIYKNIKVAVIEAKSEEVEVGEGISQAKLYGEKLQI